MAEIIVAIVIPLVTEVAKCLAPSTGRKISYLRKYKTNFQKLKEEVEKLKIETMSVQSRVNAARNNVEEIEEKVRKWLEEASKIIDEETAKKITEEEEIAVKKRCFMGLCVDLKKRYELSKGAVDQHSVVLRLLSEANFPTVAHPIILKDSRLSNQVFEAFESRISIVSDVISSLEDPHVNIVGIYGMGGIGKTTLANEVVKQVEILFDQVLLAVVSQPSDIREIQGQIADRLDEETVPGIAVVSQTPDIRDIQGQIADRLHLKLDEETVSGRAEKLRARLKQEKILVILDNIWGQLDLVEVGIPLIDDRKGCKVLLTARSSGVLKGDIRSQRSFPIDFLNDEESWSLFKKMAGDCIEGPDLKSVATEVIKGCAGLPISIVTIGSALRDNREVNVWTDTLSELKIPFSDIQERAHLAIKLSYNLLKKPELKKIFLLIGYTYITSVEDLLMYGVGLGLFQDIKMEDARNKVRELVRKLKASFMLLDDKEKIEDFVMHDVVRDVAIFIASRDRRLLTTRSQQVNQWEISRLMSPTPKRYNSIVLIDAEIHELPEALECPQLKLLSIRDRSLKLSDTFFKKTIDLRVLVLTYLDLLSLPSSLRLLTNLQTLCLYDCKLDNIAAIGDVKSLEILVIKDHHIGRLPEQVGQLTRLRSLDLRSCPNLNVIPPNVLSRLSRLEELRTGTYSQWEVESLDNESVTTSSERSNASLDELKHLSHLTALHVCIRVAKALPRDFSLFKNLARYRIFITGTPWFLERERRDPWILEHTLENTSREICRLLHLEHTNANIFLNEGNIMQLKGIQDLRLVGSLDMKNVLYGSDREGFQQLKYLQVEGNPNLLCVIDSMEHVTPKVFPFPLLESLSLRCLINMEKICYGQLTAEFFGKLRDIKIVSCDNIKNIFPFSIARGLQQLQSICLDHCQNVKEIFTAGRENESNNNSEVVDILEFGQLRSLKFFNLPNLNSFCARPSQQRRDGSNEIILADDVNVPADALFNEKVVLPNMEILELDQINVERIWQNQIAVKSCGFQNLTRLIVSDCSNLRCLFSSSIVSGFVQLQQLDICECLLLEEIVVIDNRLIEEERKNIVFPRLEFLRMKSLKSLTKFCSDESIEFPSLKELEIGKCPEFKGFTMKDMNTDLPQISLFSEKVAFPILEKMTVEHCDGLQTIFPRSTYRKFLRLRNLSVSNCGSLEVLFNMEGLNFEDKCSTVSQLSDVNIDGLPKLKHVWNMDPKNFLSFQNLKLVRIDNCDELRSVFPASIANNLSELERLHISRSGVEKIVFVSADGAETNPRFVFPRVFSLTLHDLPRCMTFYPGMHTTEWPALKIFMISGWEMVKIFNSEFLSSQESNMEGQLDITSRQTQFLIEKVFPNLKEITVKGKGITRLYQFPEDLLCKLKFVNFEVDESIDLLSLDFLKRLRRIKRLKIEGNGQYGFPAKEVENGISTWIRYLNECSCLKHILKEETNMDHLVDLEICLCHNLVDLVPPSTSFKNLTTLSLGYCDGLTNIITSSTAKSLVMLRTMEFVQCNMIVEIVAADEGEATKDHEIVFGELKKLCLFSLKSLTGFCLGNCTFNFPSLEDLRVIKCPKMNTFCEGKFNAPNLQKVKQDWFGAAGCWKDDLNSTIKQLHEKMSLAQGLMMS